MGIYAGHTSICVSDIERALGFYRDILGLKVSVDFGEMSAESLTRSPDQKMKFMLLSTDDGLQSIELFEFIGADQRKLEGRARHDDFWSSHVCFRSDNIDELCQRLVDADVEIDIPLTESDGWKFSYVFDPDGYMVEIIAM